MATSAALALGLDAQCVGKPYARLRMLGRPDDTIRQRAVNIMDPDARGGERRKSTFETSAGP